MTLDIKFHQLSLMNAFYFVSSFQHPGFEYISNKSFAAAVDGVLGNKVQKMNCHREFYLKSTRIRTRSWLDLVYVRIKCI